MWPFKPKPPEAFPFTAAMMCMALQNERYVSYVLGFERKLMHKGERGGVRAKLPFDIRPRKLVVAEESGPFFIINSIRVDAMEQLTGPGVSAAVFASDASMDCDFAMAKADQWVSLDMTCVGRATLWQRIQTFYRVLAWRLWYRLKYNWLTRRFRKREVIGPYNPDDYDDVEDEFKKDDEDEFKDDEDKHG